MIRAVVWNEFVHERENDLVRSIYPDGIHAAIAAGLAADPGIDASTATLDQPENGLPADRLNDTDVLLWWGHKAHARSTTPPSTASPSGSTRAWASSSSTPGTSRRSSSA